jgi:preprotein translocase subunit SecY
MPFFLQDQLGVNFHFGGISLVIAVSVSLDTVTQIENHLITRHYDEFGSGRQRTTPNGQTGGGGGGIKGRDRTET